MKLDQSPYSRTLDAQERSADFIIKMADVLELYRIWYLGGFGSMENTPTGRGSDLPTIL